MNPMLDKDFLRKLDRQRMKETYAEVISLDSNGYPLEKIEGRITQGSVNIDGTSSVRRTCSLTIVANELNIHQFYWGLRTKFKLSVGIKNTIDQRYPDVIWFNQGIFVISSFTTTQGLSNYTIAIQGKDKMTLLNGELGGTIMSLTHDFGKVLTTNSLGNQVQESLLIRDIIIGAVHQFATEPLYNIIINDLDNEGLELLEYRGKDPIYIEIDKNSQEPMNIILDGDQEYYIVKDDGSREGPVKISNSEKISYNPLFDLERTGVLNNITYLAGDRESKVLFSVAKLEYGQTAGYRLTDLTYPGELILNLGETITALLDKIVNMLGPYEYYYDIDGRFIFQRKKIYLNTSWNNMEYSGDEELYIQNNVYSSKISYSFDDGELISSYSNNPNFANIRNDFSVWGTRLSVTGQEIPIHMRYAVDKKPKIYVSYDGHHYTSLSRDKLTEYLNEWNTLNPNMTVNVQTISCTTDLDWRELIYQMAIDYNKNHISKEDFYVRLANKNYGNCPNGKTGYEQYYIDMEGFWRQLYNPTYTGSYETTYISSAEYDKAKQEHNKNSAKEFIYFYAKDLYKQCTEDMPFRSSRAYYSYKDNSEGNSELTLETNLNRLTYERNPTNYWYIDANDPYEIVNCLETEKYRTSGKGYYILNNNSYVEQNSVSEEEYKANPKQFYYIQGVDYIPCGEIKPYNSLYIYYTDANGNSEVTNLTKAKYLKEPWEYYWQEANYTKGSVDTPFDSSKTYYVLSTVSGTDEKTYVAVSVINEEIYNKNPAQYYLRTTVGAITACVTAKVSFNSSYKYYIREEIEEDGVVVDIKFTEKTNITANNYNDNVKRGNLYYSENIYRNCVEYIDYTTSITFYIYETSEFNSTTKWNQAVIDTPDTINFWFDFLDEDSELQRYGGHAIGNRPKTINDNKVKAIYFRETPTVIFVSSDSINSLDRTKLGYTYLSLPPYLESLFSISGQGKSAKSVVDELIYKHLCEGESINFVTLPILHLIPNTRISVRNKESGIDGEYILTRYSIDLGLSGNMTISASRAVNSLY